MTKEISDDVQSVTMTQVIDKSLTVMTKEISDDVQSVTMTQVIDKV